MNKAKFIYFLGGSQSVQGHQTIDALLVFIWLVLLLNTWARTGIDWRFWFYLAMAGVRVLMLLR